MAEESGRILCGSMLAYAHRVSVGGTYFKGTFAIGKKVTVTITMIETMDGLFFRDRISEVMGPLMLLPNIKYPPMPTTRYRGNCSSR